MTCAESAARRPFTPPDDIGPAQWGAPGPVIEPSPDGRHFVVVTERGRLDLDAPQDTLWLFEADEVQRWARHHSGRDIALTGFPLARLAADRDGPVIEQIRWLADS